MTHATQARAAIRLSASDIETVETITRALQHPHRPPPGITEILRAALAVLATSLNGTRTEEHAR